MNINTEDADRDRTKPYERIAARLLTAVRNYETACEMRMQAASLELWGHRGGFVGDEAATDDGRIKVIAETLQKEGL